MTEGEETKWLLCSCLQEDWRTGRRLRQEGWELFAVSNGLDLADTLWWRKLAEG